MSDFKAKLPDFKEITAMASKLFKDVKTSVCEIIEDYKQKHPDETPEESAPTEKPEATAEKPVKEKKNKENPTDKTP